MSMDQCHSTVDTQPASKPRAAKHIHVGVTGQAYWRSMDDLADTSEFRDWIEREFPAGASRLLDGSRREFLKLMGASVALAGAATIPGCRRPDHKIMPYSRVVPEEVIPGKPMYYATSMPLPGGGAEGLLVETHEGRPTKIEGNPLHPINNGKSSLWSQAAILGLYDPDRLKDPVFTPDGGAEADAATARSWDDFGAWSAQHMHKFEDNQGQGLAFLVEKKTSPSRTAVMIRVLERYPKARWVSYDPTQSDAPIEGARLAFGRPVREVLRLERADVIVSLDRDFLGHEPGMLPAARGFAARRRVFAAADSMNRLYAVESSFTITGAKADHRISMPPSAIPAFAVALAKELLSDNLMRSTPDIKRAIGAVNLPAGASFDQAMVKAIAKDLLRDEHGASRSTRSAILVGATQPAEVHALVHALNAGLGNLGHAIGFASMGSEEAASSAQGLAELSDAMGRREIDTLVCIGVNPVYDAPAESQFAQRFKSVPNRISLSIDDNETIAASTWRLPMAHFLESWGDTTAIDGTVAPIQPMIAPLYGAKSDIEVLAMLAGVENPDGYNLVRETWRTAFQSPDFERAWRRALHDGVMAAGSSVPVDVTGVFNKVAAVLERWVLPAPASDGKLEVVFALGGPADGRFANCPWLHELPDPTTHIVWDNVAMISAATAAKHGLEQQDETVKKRNARMITLSADGATVRVPAWVTPGIPDNTAVVAVGYGRQVCGRVGRGVGFNVFPLSSGPNRRVRTGVTIARATDGERQHEISSTQSHGSMEGRAIVREADLPAWRTFGNDPFHGEDAESKKHLQFDHYGNKRDLNFAERFGELSHTPANVNAYPNPQRGLKAPGEVAPLSEQGKKPDFASGPQWGMTIDLSSCTGCNVCTIACQAENNIPVVGKIEVNKGREMHWIRVDRYFKGDPEHVDGMVFQPVPCVHCENAPCETVCPVNATVHGPEGINYMVYNRCIGTRYCANNCPYKVRRFNFFDYGVKKFNGDYIGREEVEGTGLSGPKNVNLIPPRLRERLDEITKLQMNPDVTVRSRGVMEKCTYCIQRINEARIESKLQDLQGIPDGFFQAACQQACPTDAIVFGDILDTGREYDDAAAPGGKRTGSRVHNLRNSGRSYLLLGFINTRPRTSHLMNISNPNPELCDKERKDSWAHPFHHHGGSESDHHDHDHGDAAPHASRRTDDEDRSGRDAGHRLSLAVLGGRA